MSNLNPANGTNRVAGALTWGVDIRPELAKMFATLLSGIATRGKSQNGFDRTVGTRATRRFCTNHAAVIT